MADEHDKEVERLGMKIARLYKTLLIVCAALPLPIQLPVGNVGSTDATSAVRRVTKIAREMPIPEERQGDLFAACVYWLAAIDLFSLQLLDTDVDRTDEVAANLVAVEGALSELMPWLSENQE